MACECKHSFDELTDYIRDVYDPEHPQSALIGILHFAQEKYGYLSQEVMDHVAEVTEIPTAEIYGVATFYSYFKHTPQGKHRISVCMGTACYIRGAAKILETVQDQLGVIPGETTEDKLFTLDMTRCIGACGLAPVVMIDDHVHASVTPDRIRPMLAEYRE